MTSKIKSIRGPSCSGISYWIVLHLFQTLKNNYLGTTYYEDQPTVPMQKMVYRLFNLININVLCLKLDVGLRNRKYLNIRIEFNGSHHDKKKSVCVNERNSDVVQRELVDLFVSVCGKVFQRCLGDIWGWGCIYRTWSEMSPQSIDFAQS